MADIFSKAKRSEIMSKISGKETKPEIKVRKYLFAKGFRFRKNDKKLPGKPDIVLPKYKTVIFIHGCFWHHHENCPKSSLPTSNREFWENKINGNVERDKLNQSALVKTDWNVITIWQCQIKNQTVFKETMDEVVKNISGNSF